jgi:hypothetical protein
VGSEMKGMGMGDGERGREEGERSEVRDLLVTSNSERSDSALVILES